MIEQLLFCVFAILTCGGAIAVVVTQNVVRMAFWLVVSLGSVAALFFLLHADFLGAAQLLIYVGGTVVLLVFGVMLTASGPTVQIKTSQAETLLGAGVGLILLCVITFVIGSSDWGDLHGVLVQPIDKETAARLKLDGLRVANGSGDFKGGDVLVALAKIIKTTNGNQYDDLPFDGVAEYEELQAKMLVDSEVRATVRRDGDGLKKPIHVRIRAAGVPTVDEVRERDEKRNERSGVHVTSDVGEFKKDDVLVALDGIAVNSVPEYREQLTKQFVGSELAVTVWRDGGQLADPIRTRIRAVGVPVANDLREREERRGVRVANGSGEFRVDDMLVALDGVAINSVVEYQAQLAQKGEGSEISVTVWRDGNQLAEPIRTRIRPVGAPAAADVREQQQLENAATSEVKQSIGAVQSRRQAGRTLRQLGLSFYGLRPDRDLNRPSGTPLAPGFLLPFEIVSIHLLVVLVGAAYLARAKRKVVPGSPTEL